MEPPSDKTGGTLDYAAASTEPVRVPVDGFCMAALAASLVSFVFPPGTIAAIIFAIVGLRRRRRTGYSGKGLAVAAIVLSVVGPLAFGWVYLRVRMSPDAMASFNCQRNLRNLGTAIAIYEGQFPRATGYGWEELLAAVHTSPTAIECPGSHRLDGARPGPGRRVSSSYVLLTLDPWSSLRSPAETVRVFDMNDHVCGEAGHCINVLFADGHVETMPTVDAMRAIERSVTTRGAEPVTRPSTRAGN